MGSKMQLLSNRTRAAVVVAAVATLVTLYGPVRVWAQNEPQTPLALYACANPAGQPRFVAATEACRPNEKRFTWKAVGPSAPAGSIPNMIGRWTADLSGYQFENVADPDCRGDAGLQLEKCQPLYFAGPGGSIEITHQNGEVFAALWLDDNGVHHQLTGVVSSDGTVSIQAFNPTEQRFFIAGTITSTNGTYEIDAHGQIFDDFGLRPYGPIFIPCLNPSIPSTCPAPWWSRLPWDVKGMMGTIHYRLIKQ
jgi:hypothetical protein